MRFEVSGELGPLLALHIVDLSEFSIPEKCERLAAVNTLDVHAQGHDNLVVSVRRSLILESNLDCLVRNLHHFEVVLHLLLKDCVIQDGYTLLVHS